MSHASDNNVDVLTLITRPKAKTVSLCSDNNVDVLTLITRPEAKTVSNSSDNNADIYSSYTHTPLGLFCRARQHMLLLFYL